MTLVFYLYIPTAILVIITSHTILYTSCLDKILQRHKLYYILYGTILLYCYSLLNLRIFSLTATTLFTYKHVPNVYLPVRELYFYYMSRKRKTFQNLILLLLSSSSPSSSSTILPTKICLEFRVTRTVPLRGGVRNI
jgi:hypothetical protein